MRVRGQRVRMKMICINGGGESEAVVWPQLGLLSISSKLFHSNIILYFVKVLFV